MRGEIAHFPVNLSHRYAVHGLTLIRGLRQREADSTHGYGGLAAPRQGRRTMGSLLKAGPKATP
jgi:hypothetical protein